MKLMITLSALIGAVGLLQANSLRLFNDSSYTLKAVIRGSDGSFLGETTLPAQKEMQWTDSFGRYGFDANTPNQALPRSQTPYTITWTCMSGADYAVCDNVASGSLVMAQSCMGVRTCQSPPPPPPPTQ